MSDYQLQKSQPVERYKRQTPVLHVPTRDEWRKLGKILTVICGPIAIITALILSYQAISTYFVYVKDVVIQHGLIMTFVYGIFTIVGFFIATAVFQPQTVRGYFAISKRHRPNFLLHIVGNGLTTLLLYVGIAFTATKTYETLVGLSGRLKDLQKPGWRIAYNVVELTDVNSASDAFGTYTAHFDFLDPLWLSLLTLLLLFMVDAYICNRKLDFLTKAQELTPEEHEERQLNLNTIQMYEPIRKKAAVLLFMYDHVHPEDWIWTVYDPRKRLYTHHQDNQCKPNEITTTFASRGSFSGYLQDVWDTYVTGIDFKSEVNGSNIIIEADKVRYLDDNGKMGTEEAEQMLANYIETADERINEYLNI
jgi:hypothetical protein